MKYRNRKLQVRQVDEQLETYRDSVNVPVKGWLYTIRTSLAMTAAQLASRLVTSPQSILAFEKREVEGKITLNKLKKIGAAMDLKLVYGFVPKGSLEKMIEEKAKELAVKVVMRASTQMELEDQKISDKKLKMAIEERTQDILRNLPKNIWD